MKKKFQAIVLMTALLSAPLATFAQSKFQGGVQFVQNYTHVYITPPTFANFSRDVNHLYPTTLLGGYIVTGSVSPAGVAMYGANVTYQGGRAVIQAADGYMQMQYNNYYRGSYFPSWGR